MTRKLNETTIPRDGLVAEYLLDGNANDTAGSNDGTANNVTWGTADRGYVEEVGSFNGSSSYVDLQDTITPTNEFSFSTYIDSTNITDSMCCLNLKIGTSSYQGLFLNRDGNGEVTFRHYDNGGAVSLITPFSSGDKMNIVGVYNDDGKVKLYINGEFKVERTLTSAENLSEIISIGRINLSPFDYYNGKMGLVRIYNKALSQEEITTLSLEGLRKLGPTNSIQSNGFPLYSLPNLEEGKVLEISKPQSGGSYIDQTGNGNNGTPTNVTDSANGLNNVMSFNGSSSFISIPDNSTLDITSEICLSARVNSTKLGTQYLIAKREANVNNGYELSFSGSGKAFVRFNQNTSGNTYRLDSLTDYNTNGKWEKWSATYDGSTIKLYRNGTLDNSMSATFTIGTNSTALQLGKNTSGGYLQGEMSKPIIYNRALSPTEIQQLDYSSKII